MLMAIQKLIKK